MEDTLSRQYKVIQVSLAEYLKQLEGKEASKPPTLRREVPTLTDLAEVAGVNRVTLSNLANNHVKLVNLEILSAVLNELQRRGFPTEVSDLLSVYEIPGK